MTEQETYWKNRCQLAEAYIDESPCDPDITAAQGNAYRAWNKVKDAVIPPEATNSMTAQEQYEKDKLEHDAFIRGYRACIASLEKIIRKIPDAELQLHLLSTECSKRDSMDAPNPPGYYRANND